mgnify:CR=1 FL=1
MSTPFDDNNTNDSTGSTGSESTGSFGDTSSTDSFGSFGQTSSTESTWQMSQPSSADASAANTAQYGQPAYGAQYGQYPNQGYPQGYYQGQPMMPKEDGFFKKLFDFSFKRFVTLDSARIIYIIALVLIGMMWFLGLLFSIFFMMGMAEEGESGIGILFLFLYLIFGTFWSFVQIVCARLTIEALVNLFRTAENTTELVEQGKKDNE